MPKDSYVLGDELEIERWGGGIYFEKLTDDDSTIKIGDIGEFGFSDLGIGFTNNGRVDNNLNRFYFKFTYDNLSNYLSNLNLQFKLEEGLTDISHPFYTFNYEVEVRNLIEDQSGTIEEVDYTVKCTPENSDINFLYYDVIDKYIQTSYPIKTKLTMGVYGIELNQTPISLGNYQKIDLLYTAEYNPLTAGSTLPQDGVYRYKVIQWGDEKKLLSDDKILNSEYFYLYTSEELPDIDNYYYKRIVNNKSSQFNFTLDSFHVYNTPGLKIIKIIVYRYDSSGNILLQSTLVTKNIVINDGLLSSQDFKIFGGANFNFLPIVDNQAIIGGFDIESKYHNSVSKIVKDDNLIQEDYLERVSAKDYIKKLNNNLLGKQPGQLDLGQVRVFKEARDIYDFIGADKLEWINQGFGSLPINSLATDIFIRDDKCIVDLNPSNTEYSAIQNKAGSKEVGVIIGDYKVNQPQGGKIQKQGVMETPILDTDNEKQAF